jgi:hypothetical protein
MTGANADRRHCRTAENPQEILEQILPDRKHRGLVCSKRGKDGGYLLLKPAHEIPFGEIVRMIDGPIARLACLSQTAYRKCDDCFRRWNATSATPSPASPMPRGKCCSPSPSPMRSMRRAVSR